MERGVENVWFNCVFIGTDRGIRLNLGAGGAGSWNTLRISNLIMDGVLCHSP